MLLKGICFTESIRFVTGQKNKQCHSLEHLLTVEINERTLKLTYDIKINMNNGYMNDYNRSF